jgi:hypothetical protein
VALTTTSGALTVAANVTATSGSTTLAANSGAVSLMGPITVSAGQDVSVAASGAFSLTPTGGTLAVTAGRDMLSTSGGGTSLSGPVVLTAGRNMLTTSGIAGTSIAGATGLKAGNNIVLASSGAFTQSGTLTVTSPDLVIDTTGKFQNAGALLSQLLSSPGSDGITIQDRSVINNSAFSPSGSSNPIKFGGTLAAHNSIVLLLANKGAITGGSSGSPTIDVKALGVSGTGGSASLFGSIGGSATTAAAANGRINPVPDNKYRFNDCVIGSVTCIVLPGLTPIQPQAASQVDVLAARPAEEDIDAPLINIFDEEHLCEQMLAADPERAKEVCR